MSCEQLRLTARYATVRAGWRAVLCIREGLCQCDRGVDFAKIVRATPRTDRDQSVSVVVNRLLRWPDIPRVVRTNGTHKGERQFRFGGRVYSRATGDCTILTTQAGNAFLFLRVREGGSFLFQRKEAHLKINGSFLFKTALIFSTEKAHKIKAHLVKIGGAEIYMPYGF